MININELKKGNRLYVTLPNQQTDVVTFDRASEHYVYLEQGNGGDSEFFDPIPLTLEILETCNFSKIICPEELFNDEGPDPLCYEKGKVKIIINQSGKNYLYGNEDEPLFHLHQLQNLYFALTGEELLYQP